MLPDYHSYTKDGSVTEVYTGADTLRLMTAVKTFFYVRVYNNTLYKRFSNWYPLVLLILILFYSHFCVLNLFSFLPIYSFIDTQWMIWFGSLVDFLQWVKPFVTYFALANMFNSATFCIYCPKSGVYRSLGLSFDAVSTVPSQESIGVWGCRLMLYLLSQVRSL